MVSGARDMGPRELKEAPAFIRFQKAFSRVIRNQRNALGLTQERVAECCGIDVKHFQKIEAGDHNVELATLIALAGQLGLRIPPPSTWVRAKKSRNRRL